MFEFSKFLTQNIRAPRVPRDLSIQQEVDSILQRQQFDSLSVQEFSRHLPCRRR